jgi:DUF4097 and DUF4098 domain-containing protein YvlB
MKTTHLAAALIVVISSSATAQEQARIDTTVHLNLRGTVDLALVSGKITVRGWDQADVTILASSENGGLRFDATSNRITLRVRREEQAAAPRTQAVYDVSVPRGTRLLLRTASGSITTTGTQGEVSASTVSGMVDVSGARREVALESMSGPVRASQVAGDLRAQNVSGSVRADNISGRVEAWAVTGGIRLTNLRANDVRAQTVGGDIVYAGRVATGATYYLESHSGTIRLTVPPTAGAQFRLETVKGAVQSDFPIEASATARAQKPGRVAFRIGDGQADVIARTFSGRILIKSDGTPGARRDSGSIVRSDSAPRVRRDSAPQVRRDSASTIRKDSVAPVRKDSVSTRH